MEIFSFGQDNNTLVERVAGIIKNGGVVAGPSDTVYGLFCDATNEQAIQKMFAIKQRPEEKAFPIWVKDIASARKLVYIYDKKARFLEKVWPGQVTVVFQHKEKLPSVLTGGLNTLGIRVPDHPFLLELLNRLDIPLAQTSANISGKPSAKTAKEVLASFESQPNQPDLVIDGGETSGIASTVVDFIRENPLIMRVGVMTKRELDKLISDAT